MGSKTQAIIALILGPPAFIFGGYMGLKFRAAQDAADGIPKTDPNHPEIIKTATSECFAYYAAPQTRDGVATWQRCSNDVIEQINRGDIQSLISSGIAPVLIIQGGPTLDPAMR